MLVTPAATAQLLVVRFEQLLVVAVGIAAVAGLAGLYASYYINVPSGPSIVLLETGAFLAALGFGPRTGLLARHRGPIASR